MPPVILARWGNIQAPVLWTAPDNKTQLTVNESTLMAIHPLDTRHLLENDVWFHRDKDRTFQYGWEAVDTDFIAVCKKGIHRAARDWYFYKWDGKRFKWAEWNELDMDQQITAIGTFCRYFRRDKSWVPWESEIEESAVIMMALEQM